MYKIIILSNIKSFLIFFSLSLINFFLTQMVFAKSIPPYKDGFAPKTKAYKLIVLMDKNNSDIDSFVSDFYKNKKKKVVNNNILANANNVEYLQKKRRKIGIREQYKGLSPEKIGELVPKLPDFTLVHPDSIQARLQRYIVLTYPHEKALEMALKTLRKNKNIISVERQAEINFLSTYPNDPFFINNPNYQWGPFALNLPNAWDRLTGHAYLGLPDSGLAHPQNEMSNFRAHFSYDFEDNDPEVFESTPSTYRDTGTGETKEISVSGHGTHVFGIMAGESNNGIGIAGTCWGCSVAFARQGRENPESPLNSLQHMHDLGVQAINMSLSLGINDNKSCDDTNPSLPPSMACDLLSALNERDILVVAAAGNGHLDQVGRVDASMNPSKGRVDHIDFPASDSTTIAVGAISHSITFSPIDIKRAVFSDYGPQLDVVAPGFDILSTQHQGLDYNPRWFCGDQFGVGSDSDGYGLCSGTSMSTPFVTGIVGLMRSADPLLLGDKIKEALFESSSHYNAFPANPELANGLPDAAQAVDKVLGVVNGSTLENRLTPLFSFYSWSAQDSFYTTVPQMGCPAIEGTLLPQPLSAIANYYPFYGSQTIGYNAFPSSIYECNSQPMAEVYVFTTNKNTQNPNQSLVPLYRLSYQGNSGGNSSNLDHVYTTEQTGITAYENVGYKLDGIEGYIYSNKYPQPPNTEKLYRMYNSVKDDHALFPEHRYSAMYAQGYTIAEGGNAYIGYVYLNADTDSDGLINGFEEIAGTCVNDTDSDSDGVSDGLELKSYPRTDPLSNGLTTCGVTNSGGSNYPWQQSLTGILDDN